ncbi:MAG TPA: alpha/beta-type small acid-soluble spore protein [Bacillota bacterium]|nr:alpha/beta-type small acid-soluble spore protein [Bacillota bacterium]
MPGRKRPVEPKAQAGLERLKHEVAEDLGLDDDIRRRGWPEMTTRETGAVGGNMVRRMVGGAEEELARQTPPPRRPPKREEEEERKPKPRS